jgi:hypothetical protein
MDFVTALAAATQGLQTLKALREIDKAADVAEWKARLAEIQVALSDAKVALQDAKEEIAAKDREIARILTTVKRCEDLTFYYGFHYVKNPDGHHTGEPFCPICLEEKGVLRNLARLTGKHQETYVCPKCKADFGWIPH